MSSARFRQIMTIIMMFVMITFVVLFTDYCARGISTLFTSMDAPRDGGTARQDR